MANRLQETLAKFRQSQASNTKIAADLGRERERKKAERKTTPAARPKRTTPTPSAKATTKRRDVPLSKLIKDVLDCVFKADQALTVEDIKTQTGVDILNDDELLAQLKRHDNLDLVNNFWSYRAKHKARNKEELLKLLMKYPEGLVASELKDAYKGVAEDIKSLKMEKRLLCIQNKDDGSQDVLFPYDPKLAMHVDDDVVTLWEEAEVDLDNMEAELKKAGIKESSRKEKRTYDLHKKKERKKRNVKQRVFTNAHMMAETKAEPS